MMPDGPTAHTDNLLIPMEARTIKYLLDLISASGQETALAPMLPLTSLTVAAVGRSAIRTDVSELIAAEADDFLGTAVDWVLEAEAIHAEELLWAEGAVVAEAVAAEAADRAVEVPRLFRLFLVGRLFVRRLVQLVQFLQQVARLGALPETLAQLLVVEDCGVLGLQVEWFLAFLDIQWQSRCQLLQQLLYN